MVTLIGGPPSAFWRATIAASAAIWSATDAPWLRMPKPSVAQTTTLASSTPGGQRAVPAALVEHQADARAAVGVRQGGHDRLGAGHLRHAALVDERHRLDPPGAAGLQAADEVDLVRRLQDGLLVLQPVARADFDDLDEAWLMGRT